MNKIWLIIQREYLTRVKKRSFIITTMLAPLSIIVLFSIQFFIISMGSEKKRIVIKDDSTYFVEKRGNGFGVKIEEAGNLTLKGSDLSLEELLVQYKDMGYDGVLHIPSFDIDERMKQNFSGIVYYSDNLLGLATKTGIEQNLSNLIRSKKIEVAGLDKNLLGRLKTSVNIQEKKDNADGTETSSIIASAIGGLIGFIMYLTIVIYGTMVMRGVMEEKTNRIVEVILSSVKPFKLMIGKIVGIGAVGLTQFMIWIFTVGLLYLGMGLLLSATMDPSQMEQFANSSASQADTEQIQFMVQEFMDKFNTLPLGFLAFAFIFYYLGGYLFYSALFAAVGSAVGDDSSESQALVFPITIPIIISFIILTAIIENPNGPLAFWASIIPFSSPIIMPARIAYGLSPWSIDFILSAVLLILGFICTTWFAAKIYRTGILMMGKKVTLKEMVKWLRY